jgi:hypothetical protein
VSDRDDELIATLPTGVRPDAISDEYVVLIKGCSALRLTHQIRLATAMAQFNAKCLLLVVRSGCTFGPDLTAFIEQHATLIEVRRS